MDLDLTARVAVVTRSSKLSGPPGPIPLPAAWVPRMEGGAQLGSARGVTGAGDHERQPVDRLDTDLLAELERLLTARVPDLSPQPHAAERRAAVDHLSPLADEPLGTGRDRVAAQEPDPEEGPRRPRSPPR